MKLNHSTRTLALPSSWDPRCAAPRLPVHPSAGPTFKFEQGTKVKYVGPDNAEAASSVRANCCIPKDCALYFYEVTVLSCREDCSVSVGFCPDEYAFNKLPFYAYHGSGGCISRGVGPSPSYGPCFGAGDTIGAMLNRSEGTITFFKNGINCGTAVSGVGPDEQLCPCIAMRCRDDELVASFTGPFKLDIDAWSSECLSQVLHEINACRLTPTTSTTTTTATTAAGSHNTIITAAASHNTTITAAASHNTTTTSRSQLLSQLVLDYLVHYRCTDTVAAMQRDLGVVSGSQPASNKPLLLDLQHRQEVFDAVVQGDIDTALQLMQQHYSPAALHHSPHVLFKLKCQKFVELVGQHGGDCQAALGYARAELTPTPQSCEEQELLADALSLLAYKDPRASPSGNLLNPDHRRVLAEEVNGMLLQFQGKAGRPLLEVCYRQAHVCLEELKSRSDVKAWAVDSVRAVLR